MVAFLVIVTILAFIGMDALLQLARARRKLEIPINIRYPVSAFTLENVSLPAGIFLDSGHTWIGVDPSGRARVGADDFVQRAVGRVDEIELPAVGQEVRHGETLFATRQGNRKVELPAPLDGVIAAVNESVSRYPETIKEDPYHEGWVCSIVPKNLAKDLKRLSIAEEAWAWIQKEIARFQEFITARPLQYASIGQVLQDGGEVAGGALEFMDDESWSLFTRDFIRRESE